MLNHLSDEEDIDEMKETCEQDVKVELDTLSGWTLHNILYSLLATLSLPSLPDSLIALLTY